MLTSISTHQASAHEGGRAAALLELTKGPRDLLANTCLIRTRLRCRPIIGGPWPCARCKIDVMGRGGSASGQRGQSHRAHCRPRSGLGQAECILRAGPYQPSSDKDASATGPWRGRSRSRNRSGCRALTELRSRAIRRGRGLRLRDSIRPDGMGARRAMSHAIRLPRVTSGLRNPPATITSRRGRPEIARDARQIGDAER